MVIDREVLKGTTPEKKENIDIGVRVDPEIDQDTIQIEDFLEKLSFKLQKFKISRVLLE